MDTLFSSLRMRYAIRESFTTVLQSFNKTSRFPGEMLQQYASRLEEWGNKLVTSNEMAQEALPILLYNNFTMDFPDLLMQKILDVTHRDIRQWDLIIRVAVDFFENHPSYKMNQFYIQNCEYKEQKKKSGKKDLPHKHYVNQIMDQEDGNPLEINVVDETEKCFRCGKYGHYARHCPTTGDRKTTKPYQGGANKNNGYKGKGWYSGKNKRKYQDRRSNKRKYMKTDEEPKCICGKPGHTWLNCFTRKRAVQEFAKAKNLSVNTQQVVEEGTNNSQETPGQEEGAVGYDCEWLGTKNE